MRRRRSGDCIAIAVFERVYEYVRGKLATNYDDALKALAEERGYGDDIEGNPEIGQLVIDWQDAGPRDEQGMQFYAADIDIDALEDTETLRYPVACMFPTGANDSPRGFDRQASAQWDGSVESQLRIWLRWKQLDGRTPSWGKYGRDARLVADAVVSAINGSMSETACVLGGFVDSVSFSTLQTIDNGKRQSITFRISARVAL